MSHQIVSREMIRQRARFAFLHGQDRDSHNMNPSNALDTWLAEWDRLSTEFPMTQCATAARGRVDAAQASAC